MYVNEYILRYETSSMPISVLSEVYYVKHADERARHEGNGVVHEAEQNTKAENVVQLPLIPKHDTTIPRAMI